MSVLKKKVVMTLVKDGKIDFIQDYCKDIGTTMIEFCSRGERLGSALNTEWTSGNLQPRSRVGVSGWKVTKRKHQE